MSTKVDIAESLRKTLHLRPVVQDDFEDLVEMRKECGWGEERLRKTFLSPARPTVILLGNLPDGQEVNVGMAGLTLEDEGDVMSNKEEGKVQIVGLYIRQQYQKMGLGSLSIDLLEEHAIQAHGAQLLTLDTTAYQLTRSSDGLYWDEDFSKRNPVWDMYQRRGYQDWGAPEARYPNGSGPPLHLIKMRRAVGYHLNVMDAVDALQRSFAPSDDPS